MAQRDAIEILTHDHREVEQMFAEFETATANDRKQTLVEQMVIELVRHSIVEEEYLYPAAKETLPNGAELVEREIREHQQAEKTMNELEHMSPDNVEYTSKVHTLMQEIRQHVAEEEGELFPMLRQRMSQDELVALGQKLESGKKLAPTRPHPSAPNHPPFNKMAAPGAALVDRVRDWISGRGKEG